jgi:uncharacterized membrane protein (UPF0182 family)
MASWFDKLLEELQRKQAEQDARREGRPFPAGPRRPRNVGGDRGGNGSGDGSGGGGGRGNGADHAPRPAVELGDYRRWIIIGGLVVAALVVLGLLGGGVSFITDLMWYDALGLSSVLTTRLFAQIGLFAVGVLAFAIPAAISIFVARRIAARSPIRKLGGIDLSDASTGVTLAVIGAAALFALISGAAWGGSWQTILLFANGGDFGKVDPNFGKEIGFFVFDIPFWRFVQGWGVVSLIGIIGLSLAAYAAVAMRWQFHLTAPVRAHLSILGAILLVVIAAGYQLDIYELSYSTRGVSGTIQAATYTDLHAQEPAYVILTVVALVSAAILLANIWFRTLWLLVLSVGAWFVLSILVGGIYPSAVQRFQVDPNELNVERPYIAQHIAATRDAFDLDGIDSQKFTGEQSLSRQVFDDNQTTLDNMRLWDYRPLLVTFGQQQILRQYYDFLDVDIDRYQIDGAQREIMLSAREIKGPPEGAQNWTNEHLVYTHGYGITAVPVNAVTPEGQPDYLVSGINQEPKLPVGQPRIYFGEGTSSYVVVGTNTDELDYPLENQQQDAAITKWTGTTGVSLGNPINRALFALRFGDLNLLISNQLTSDSQIIFRRSLADRVKELAPFLGYDRDPYLVSADNKLLWIWDAYTLTDRYPNSEPLKDLFPGANYIRNSVKVVVDAYDGTVTFYIADASDPIVNAYARIFPDLFRPISDMSADLEAHLRYPEDLFTAQNESYLLYHVAPDATGAATFYNRQDVWAFPTQQTDPEAGGGRSEPYYVIMKLPGETEGEFVLIQPLVVANRPNMIAWVAARMDPGHYGERIDFRFPSDSTTHGPAQIQARIQQDSTISSQFTLWSRAGSSVVRGDLLVLPMGDSILYVEPIFLRSTESSFPEFKRVILASQTRIAFAETLDEGLRQILGEAPVPPPTEEEPPPGGGGGGELPSDVAGLVAQAQQLYSAAQTALAAGDLGTYQDRVDDLQSVLDRLAALTGASPAPVPSPVPSPSG